jgi:hypothetical protein
MTDADFTNAFEACLIPAADWKHRSHLKIAYLYLREHSFAEALNRIRAGIKRLNATTNTPDALDRGYHETMTVAWLRLVEFTLREYGPAATADEFIDAQEHLLNRKALRFFYSRDHILTWKAKTEFVPPDITPLPQSQKA